ncbi:MAG TPA: 2-amino-4-hydroxy-6-hydroxymethyldihydropteridine diphosphokinase [Blastocatellia bacterium]|jgi:2-amino-4-hydroxy-6-hydroxymethyldihydropteridine diphosphokinase|nr:2-amino-4-hydroxy-6-hydroxymethyldihydropteridine diphosphokinase [Blastocatellia bacterium]
MAARENQSALSRQARKAPLGATSRGLSIYIALGTNVGDRESNLARAVERIDRLHLKLLASRIERLRLAVSSVSSIYETEPVGFRDQPWFLNQVVEAKVPLDAIRGVELDAELLKRGRLRAGGREFRIGAEELLEDLLEIESDMGRERLFANGPRIIDIDLLMLDRVVIRPASPAGLSLPHPRMHLRRFVLEPLCEIAPDAVHPATGKTARRLLAEVGDASEIRLHAPAPGHEN